MQATLWRKVQKFRRFGMRTPDGKRSAVAACDPFTLNHCLSRTKCLLYLCRSESTTTRAAKTLRQSSRGNYLLNDAAAAITCSMTLVAKAWEVFFPPLMVT